MEVLIASGDADWTTAVAARLGDRHGHRIHQAATMAAALDRLRQGPADLVVLGLDLPDRPDLQGLEAIRARLPRQPIVLVHRPGERTDLLAAKQMGDPRIMTRDAFLEEAPTILSGLDPAQEDDADNEAVRAQEVRHLREMEDLRVRFLNVTAHELSTPLTPISMGIDLLVDEKHGPLTDRQKETLGMIGRNIAWLDKTVNSLRDAARLQERRLDLDPKPTDLGTLVASAVEPLIDRFRDKGLRLAQDLSASAPVAVDRDRLQQVVAYLLDNAYRFTPAGGSVRIATEERDGDAQVVVEDSGVGMDTHQLMGIFYPLAQLHDTTDETRSGAGLSLFLARGIVEAHGGRIWAESQGTDKGSRFTFTLPLAEAVATTPPS